MSRVRSDRQDTWQRTRRMGQEVLVLAGGLGGADVATAAARWISPKLFRPLLGRRPAASTRISASRRTDRTVHAAPFGRAVRPRRLPEIRKAAGCVRPSPSKTGGPGPRRSLVESASESRRLRVTIPPSPQRLRSRRDSESTRSRLGRS